jgi:hypothetical protein
MPPPPRNYPSGPLIVVNGRVLAPSAYRPSTLDDIEDTPAWWNSLALLGSLLILGGILVDARMGDVQAIAGTGLFFVTAVLAGVQRTELATATGVSGVVWTSAGISVVLGTNPSPIGAFLAFGLIGGAALLAGVLGGARTGARGATAP